MRRICMFKSMVGFALLGLAGCVHHDPKSELKPNRPEEYTVPPPGTYTKPPDYPKEYMNQTPFRKDNGPDDVPAPSQAMPRMGNPGRSF